MTAPVMHRATRFFDLNQRTAEQQDFGDGAIARLLSRNMQFVIYAAMILGVVFSSFMFEYTSGDISGQVGADTKTVLGNWAVWLFASMVALFLLPTTYERLRLSGASPRLVQFALAFQQGVFWQVLVAGAGKAIP